MQLEARTCWEKPLTLWAEGALLSSERDICSCSSSVCGSCDKMVIDGSMVTEFTSSHQALLFPRKAQAFSSGR